VAFDNLLADGKAHAGTFVFAGFSMKPSEGGKDRFKMFLFEPNSIVLEEN
jgi:hypothetical protein